MIKNPGVNVFCDNLKSLADEVGDFNFKYDKKTLNFTIEIYPSTNPKEFTSHDPEIVVAECFQFLGQPRNRRKD